MWGEVQLSGSFSAIDVSFRSISFCWPSTQCDWWNFKNSPIRPTLDEFVAGAGFVEVMIVIMEEIEQARWNVSFDVPLAATLLNCRFLGDLGSVGPRMVYILPCWKSPLDFVGTVNA